MPASPGLYVDTSRFPLVVNTQVGALSDAQVTAYLSELDELSRFDAPFAIVLDLRQATPFNSKQRRMLSDWMETHPQHMERLKGIAFVHDSTLMRGAMQAVFWLLSPKYEYTIVRELTDATCWAATRAGVALREVG